MSITRRALAALAVAGAAVLTGCQAGAPPPPAPAAPTAAASPVPAHTTITWLPPQDGPGWTPTGMNVTPPDETRSAHIDWPGGAVLRQDGATHPGTFISPVRPGAEG